MANSERSQTKIFIEARLNCLKTMVQSDKSRTIAHAEVHLVSRQVVCEEVRAGTESVFLIRLRSYITFFFYLLILVLY